VVGQQADGFKLAGVEHVGFVDGQDRDSAAFGVLAGEQVHGLRSEGGVVGLGDAAEGGHDGVVDAADADGGVAEVDEGVAGGILGGDGGAQGRGLARADFPCNHTECVLADAPADPGGGLGGGGVAVQHAGCEVTAEGDAGGESVVGLQALDHVVSLCGRRAWVAAWRARAARSGSVAACWLAMASSRLALAAW
jgi:hypothetical protein